MVDQEALQTFVASAIAEDVGPGDYSTLACIPPGVRGKAVLKIKQEGILAGMEFAEAVFRYLEPVVSFQSYKQDGDIMKKGEEAFLVEGYVHTLLSGERVALNCMQRMSGIATLTRKYVEKLEGFNTRLLDTRKTTPGFRLAEKEAVRIGGGVNHRMGLYDMIMLKDNHIDFCGGITGAIERVADYLERNGLDLLVEVEVRTLDDIREVLKAGKVNRILIDNFSPDRTREAIGLIAGRMETESSGGITLDNIREYARTGVNYISAGSVIHQAVSLDLSLKAIGA